MAFSPYQKIMQKPFVGPPSPYGPPQGPPPPGPIAAPGSLTPNPVAPPMARIAASKINPWGATMADPGFRAEEAQKSQEGLKYGVTQNLRMTPEQHTLEMSLATGHEPQQARDEHGQLMFQEDPTSGRQVPVYDVKNAPVNPEHPYQEQLRGLEGMRQMITKEAEIRQPQANLAPLAALADAWAGPHSHLAESYQQPNPNAVNDKVLAYADEMQKRRADLAKDAIGQAAIGRNAGTFTDMMNSMAAQSSMVGQRTPRAPSPHGGEVNPQKVFHLWTGEADKALKGLEDSAGEIASARQLISDNNPVAFGSSKIKTILALGAGKRITNMELQNEPGSRALLDQINQQAELLSSGKWTTDNRQNYIKMLDRLDELHQGVMQKKHDFLQQSLAAEGGDTRQGSLYLSKRGSASGMPTKEEKAAAATKQQADDAAFAASLKSLLAPEPAKK